MAEQDDKRPSFWATAPGVMTGVAALATALVTVLAFLGFGGHGSDSSNAPATAATQGRPQAATATTAGGPVPAAGARVVWQGQLLLNNAVDFDATPPDRNPGSTEIDVSVDDMSQGPHLIETFDGGAIWDRGGTPTEQQCADKLASSSVTQVLLDVGTQVCLNTSGGTRVVLLTVLKVNPDSYSISATIWAKQ